MGGGGLFGGMMMGCEVLGGGEGGGLGFWGLALVSFSCDWIFFAVGSFV